MKKDLCWTLHSYLVGRQEAKSCLFLLNYIFTRTNSGETIENGVQSTSKQAKMAGFITPGNSTMISSDWFYKALLFYFNMAAVEPFQLVRLKGLPLLLFPPVHSYTIFYFTIFYFTIFHNITLCVIAQMFSAVGDAWKKPYLFYNLARSLHNYIEVIAEVIFLPFIKKQHIQILLSHGIVNRFWHTIDSEHGLWLKGHWMVRFPPVHMLLKCPWA